MPVGTALARPCPTHLRSARPRIVSYSTCIAEAVMGQPQRGLVHSAFHAAANIVFPGDFVLSLNTATSPRMPNGIQLSTLPGTLPMSHLRVGMPILLGAQRLCIQPLDYTLDLSNAIQWHPHIERPVALDMGAVRKNIAWLGEYVLKESWRSPFNEESNGRPPACQSSTGHDGRPPACQSSTGHDGRPPACQSSTGHDGRPQGATPHVHPTPVPTMSEHDQPRHIVGTGVGWTWGVAPCGRPSSRCAPLALNPLDFCGRPSSRCELNSVLEMAHSLCGRGIGLTPTGDDMLAGWMAIGWLLHGPQPDFLAACQHIMAIARLQTHLLSQCWLEYATNGYVAEPVGTLIYALTQEDEQQLAHSTQAVLAMGATSGYDLIQGILMATNGL